MGLPDEKKLTVKETIKLGVRNKFHSFHLETIHMPFHQSLLGQDKMALFSFIHSINSTFRHSIYEPVAVQLATGRFKVAKTRNHPQNKISEISLQIIRNIIFDLMDAKRTPNREIEFTEIKSVCQNPPIITIRPGMVDIWLEDSNDHKYLIKLITVKPTFIGLPEYKRKFLEWVAQELCFNPETKIYPIIGIPYNPNHPKPYDKWWMSGLFETKVEVLVGNELWDFIGGEGTYLDLLDCFEEAGNELRPEIDNYLAMSMD
jgi:hypothetical protein